jgi:hypothetical protein
MRRKRPDDPGRTIGCVTPSDTLIVCSVSNWGGYALGAAMAAQTLRLRRGALSSEDGCALALHTRLPYPECLHAHQR